MLAQKGGVYMEIKREKYLNQLIQKRHNGRVKVITGIRRSGKSYLLFKLYKDYLISEGVKEGQIVELVLDDLSNIEYRNPFHMHEHIKGVIEQGQRDTPNLQYYVFIDEVQYAVMVDNPYLPESARDISSKITFVDVLLGLMKMPYVDVYVTGSNSRMLSSDILTQFRDRGDRVHVHPLSYKELYNHASNPSAVWKEYYLYGGMPHIQSLSSHEEKREYLKGLFRETYVRDVVERNAIQDAELLETLLDFIASSIGSLTNPTKLANRFLSECGIRVSHTSISRYLSFFEEAYILYTAQRYDVKGSHYFSTPLKYYFADIGLRNARLNFRQSEENHIMENILYNELIQWGYAVDVGVVDYIKTEQGMRQRVRLEVDFIVHRGDVSYYIQSAFALHSEEKRLQETLSLRKIPNSFTKIVVVKDRIIPWSDEYGIIYIGIEDFLLLDGLDRGILTKARELKT